MLKTIYIKLKLIVLLLVCIPSYSQQPNVLNLVSPNFPPYTYEIDNQIVGIGPDIVRRVFANTNIPYKITMIEDYAKAVHVMKMNLGDGMFLASQNSERDAIAVFTQPLVINKWSWFVLKDSQIDLNSKTFKSQAAIGTVLGTNTYKWLKSNGYNVMASPIEASSLVSMLMSHRIDAVFLSEAVFEYEIDEQALSKLKKVVEVEKDFGMYISRDYLRRHPNSLEKINRSIKKITYKQELFLNEQRNFLSVKANH